SRETSDCLHTTPRYALYTDGATVTEGGPGEPTDSMNAFELRNAPARGGFRALRDPSGRASRSGHAGAPGRGAKLSETTGRQAPVPGPGRVGSPARGRVAHAPRVRNANPRRHCRPRPHSAPGRRP